MKSNFERSLALVLVHEGGWSDHPADPGGATMRGVTLATFRAYFGRDASKDELRNIRDDQLSYIYRRGYWNAVKGDTLASGVDLATFDFAVNSGPTRARTYLLKAIGGDDATTINRLCDARLAFLRGLKTWPTFGKGWTRRVEAVRREALRMASKSSGANVPAKPQPSPTAAPVARKAPAGIIGMILAAIGAGVVVILKARGVI